MDKSKKKQRNAESRSAKKSPLSGAFLQTREWAKFQSATGKKTLWVDGVLVLYSPIAFGLSYAYVPRPQQLDKKKLEAIITKAKEDGCVFVRVDPIESLPVCKQSVIKVKDHQPAVTRIIDLIQSEEDLLSSMKSKTRYNVRLAKKKGVEIKKARGPWGIKKFIRLVDKTAKRHSFGLHSEDYYKEMISSLSGEEATAHLFVARYNKKSRAAALVLRHGNTATYLHGGSSEKDKNVMAPYLLHWTIMQWAKKHGCHYYDLWGVAPEGKKDHRLQGVSRFKEGFGGVVVEYPGTFEIPIRQFWYSLIRAYRHIK